MEAIDKQIARVIGPSETHRKIIGIELTKAREARGLLQYQFAIEAGWDASFQSRIERPGVWNVSFNTASKIEEMLRRFSVIELKI